MIALESDLVVFCDVDDTLVKWNYTKEEEERAIIFDNFGVKTPLVPHLVHIEQLMKHKARGHMVIVWSQGGWEWSQEVVKKLGIEDYVDLVISKPRWFYDDLPSSAFMPDHIRIYKEDKK